MPSTPAGQTQLAAPLEADVSAARDGAKVRTLATAVRDLASAPENTASR